MALYCAVFYEVLSRKSIVRLGYQLLLAQRGVSGSWCWAHGFSNSCGCSWWQLLVLLPGSVNLGLQLHAQVRLDMVFPGAEQVPVQTSCLVYAPVQGRVKLLNFSLYTQRHRVRATCTRQKDTFQLPKWEAQQQHSNTIGRHHNPAQLHSDLRAWVVALSWMVRCSASLQRLTVCTLGFHTLRVLQHQGACT